MSDYIITNGELKHYGVPGMKWGVRKQYYSDKRTRRKLTRQLAAEKRNLKFRGKAVDKSEEDYLSAHKDLQKELRFPRLSRRKKIERVDMATRRVTAAGARKERSISELDRAERLYKDGEKALKNHVDSMVKKYGSDQVKGLGTKEMKVGKQYTQEVLKTGVTLADMPLVGGWYSGNYVSKVDRVDREGLIEEKGRTNKRY